MKNRWMAATMAFLMVIGSVGAALVPTDAEARRFGGARSQGMQRSMPAQRPATPPAQQAQPNAPVNAAAPTAGAAAAAAAPRRSWMGPIAGLAAGLGLAALFSHLGLGEELANFMMIALMVVAAVVVIGLLMKRFGGARSAAPQASACSPPAWARCSNRWSDAPKRRLRGRTLPRSALPVEQVRPVQSVQLPLQLTRWPRLHRLERRCLPASTHRSSNASPR